MLCFPLVGMTSEGGGAVAFPVMTLALHITPAVARDFSLMIQSCGEYGYGIISNLDKINYQIHACPRNTSEQEFGIWI